MKQASQLVVLQGRLHSTGKWEGEQEQTSIALVTLVFLVNLLV